MTVFVKNNNNNKVNPRTGRPYVTGVAYYNVGQTFAYNGWECNVEEDFAGCGQTLWVNSSNRELLSEPNIGDRILIYQNIGSTGQVVTHYVECVGAQGVPFKKQFSNAMVAQMVLEPWRFTREMRIVAVLNPSVFGARRPKRDEMQLRDGPHQNQLPTMTDIVGQSMDYQDGFVHPIPAGGIHDQATIEANLRQYSDLYTFSDESVIDCC